MIQFDESVCRNLDAALRREWLETNGLGGYASSTIVGLNTRRYHGLLVAATRPPVCRIVLLSKLEETLILGGRRYDLAANRYPGVVHPQGYQYMNSFRQDPFPVFTYEIEGVKLEKSVWMVDGENTTLIQYDLPGATRHDAMLELRPLIAFRDFHATTHENNQLDPRFKVEPGCVSLTPYAGLPPLYLAHGGAGIRESGYWYRNFEFDAERARGLDYREDLFNPLVLVFDLSDRPQAVVIASTGPHAAAEAGELRSREIARRAELVERVPARPMPRMLAAAADKFLVRRESATTVIAGYHWFSDWGRDTMIALPGLTLATRSYGRARSILRLFAAHADQGMLPNRFPDAGEATEYNSVDAALWYFEAVRAFVAHTGQLEFVGAELYGVLADIIAWHERGTRYGIHMDVDGLIQAGAPGVQLTWMDAKVGDDVVTLRRGKPVEIQALWYNALRVMEDLAGRFGRGDQRDHYRGLADRARQSFVRLFWNEAGGCLYDVVDGDARDASMRPNQVLAVSLRHGMLPADKERAVVEAVERDLLTPYGLRSLALGDSRYQGRYEGDVFQRDHAYHQGTVWPWLMGPFIQAYLKVHGGSPDARARTAAWLAAFEHYMLDEGVGQVSEVFDGDAPQRPGGCITQAWSVAELLRAALEDFV